MASSQDVREARHRFEAEIDADPATTARIVDSLTDRYAAEIARASRQEILRAAAWAADRLQQRFPGGRLERASPADIADALVEGCPLCGDWGGSSGAATTPARPVARQAEATA